MTPIFKTHQGVYLTKQLFWELSESPELVLYTIKDYDIEKDGRLLPSLHRRFVELGDLSEYTFATTYFDSWAHYKKLLKTSWFSAMMDEAREELSVKLAAQNLLEISKKAQTGDVRANQYLLERKWVPKDDPVGRPSKSRIKEEANRLFDISEEINSDLRRLGS